MYAEYLAQVPPTEGAQLIFLSFRITLPPQPINVIPLL